jgi:RluA family pseudouridine synthase
VAIKKVRLITTTEHALRRLDQVLADWLPGTLTRPVSKAKVRKLIVAGAVSVNARPVRNAARVLSSGAIIEASVDVAKLFDDSTSRDRKFELTADRVLFEDDDLIVVDKPAGLPAHPTADEARDNLVAAVQRFLSERDGISKPYIGIHQRLDRDTSGVVLFTKSQRVNAAITEMFSAHKIVKIYEALTVAPSTSRSRKKIEKEWTIKNYLGKIPSRSKRTRYGAVSSDGSPAETTFRVIERRTRGIWVEAIPRTGRTHQIRVHLAEYGLPVLGDDLYGAAEQSFIASRLMLHAKRLMFRHPITQQEALVESPLPPDFQECLHQLGATERRD